MENKLSRYQMVILTTLIRSYRDNVCDKDMLERPISAMKEMGFDRIRHCLCAHSYRPDACDNIQCKDCWELSLNMVKKEIDTLFYEVDT